MGKRVLCIGCVRKLVPGFERLVLSLAASVCIDVLFKYACFDVLARTKTAHSRADGIVFRQSLATNEYFASVFLTDMSLAMNENLNRRDFLRVVGAVAG